MFVLSQNSFYNYILIFKKWTQWVLKRNINVLKTTTAEVKAIPNSSAHLTINQNFCPGVAFSCSPLRFWTLRNCIPRCFNVRLQAAFPVLPLPAHAALFTSWGGGVRTQQVCRSPVYLLQENYVPLCQNTVAHNSTETGFSLWSDWFQGTDLQWRHLLFAWARAMFMILLRAPHNWGECS